MMDNIYLVLKDISAQPHIDSLQLHPDDLKPLAKHPVRQQIQKFSRYHRREILAKALGVSSNALTFAITTQGKPYLSSHANLAFNQSHTEQSYALIWSLDIPEIGVDIETLARQVQQPAMAKHTLTPWELEQWEQTGQSHAYWLKLWTIKEAVLKASGLGIRLNLNELETQCLPNQQQGIVKHGRIGEWGYQSSVLHQYILTVSWRMTDKQVKIHLQ